VCAWQADLDRAVDSSMTAAGAPVSAPRAGGCRRDPSLEREVRVRLASVRLTPRS